MYNTLNEIKEQLFDAPVDVKEAFNSIVEYFDLFKKYYVIYNPTANTYSVMTKKDIDESIKIKEAKLDNLPIKLKRRMIKNPFIEYTEPTRLKKEISALKSPKAGPFRTKEKAEAKKKELELE